ncbi:MAG: universal stress protein [Anaerolineae bacterium]|jgi:nucleotide-binding universal stress UspA family protein
MDERAEGVAIRRILIALDASQHSLAALRAAAVLASSLEAELQALFVEDTNLLRAAGLPMAKELEYPFASHAQMHPKRMERQLRAQASQARRALASICAREHVEWTFQVVRGSVAAKVIEEAAKADLLCLGRTSRPLVDRRGLGSTARAAATRAERSVLLISHGAPIRPPVVLVYDGSSCAEQALLLASRLTEDLGGLLWILVPAGASKSSDEIQEQIADRVDGEKIMIRYRELSGSGITALISAVQVGGCGILVVSKAMLPSDQVQVLVDAVDCPLILVQ